MSPMIPEHYAHELDELRLRIREAFRAGFVAHPEAEAPVFKWSFDAKTCIAADREESAWKAWSESDGLRLSGCDCDQDGHPEVGRHASDCEARR
jgi:hypothetical protein